VLAAVTFWVTEKKERAMNRAKWIALALFAVVGMSAAQEAVLTSGVPVQGVFSGTPVTYSYQAVAGESVLFEVSSATFDPAIEVYDGTGYLGGDDNGGDGNNGAVGVTFSRDGVFQVTIVSYSSTGAVGDFTLSAQPLPLVTDALLVPGQTVRSFIGGTFPTFNVLLDRDMSILFSLLTYSFPPRITLLDVADNVLQTTENNILWASVPAGAYRIRLEYAFESSFTAPPYFAVSLEETIVEAIGYGQTVNRDDTGKRAAFFTFNALAGDTFNIRVQSADPANVGASFTVYSPDNSVAFYSEGSSGVSYIQKQQVQADGTYRVEVRPYGETFSMPFSLLLEQAQRSTLSATPTQVVFDGTLLSDTFNMSVEAGKAYRLTVRTDNINRPLTAVVMNVITQIATVSGFGTRGISLEFVAQETTTYQAMIRSDIGGMDGVENVDQGISNLTITLEEIPQ
jgi:hypothetical protein